MEFDESDAEIFDDDEGASIFVSDIIIRPVGYPIRMAGLEGSGNLIIDDPDLFEKYCLDQWNSMHVDVGTFLFDQYILPDFAFQVIAVKPEAGRIGPKTKIHLERAKVKFSTKISLVKLSDVIGQDAAKNKTRIVLKYLKDPEIFGVEWAPKNILFHGPPGTGKTMLARALANEVKASFIARKGTSLIGVHVGDGSKKIHELYEYAKTVAPCIIFIDEIDAVGLDRSFQHVRGDVIEVATALLSELDGLEANKGVVTIACTNQVNLLDSALRSRFEEEIKFTLPNLRERVQLIKHYAKKSPIKVEMNYDAIASRTENWSGRDIKEKLLKNLIHEAILTNKKLITTKMAMTLIDRLKGHRKNSSYSSLSF
ncbi:MAG: AAA family ATPase [Promethearchaeota archaeon]